MRLMPKFREIDEPGDDDIEDIENPFRIRRITIEERDAILRKSKEKLTTSGKFVEKRSTGHSLKIEKTETQLESNVEKDELSSDTKFERIKRTIQEYGGTEEEFDELMDEISGSFEVHSSVIEKEKSDKSEVATVHCDSDPIKTPSASSSTPKNGVCSSLATKGKKSWIKVRTISEFNAILNRHQWLCD